MGEFRQKAQGFNGYGGLGSKGYWVHGAWGWERLGSRPVDLFLFFCIPVRSHKILLFRIAEVSFWQPTDTLNPNP